MKKVINCERYLNINFDELCNKKRELLYQDGLYFKSGLDFLKYSIRTKKYCSYKYSTKDIEQYLLKKGLYVPDFILEEYLIKESYKYKERKGIKYFAVYIYEKKMDFEYFDLTNYVF